MATKKQMTASPRDAFRQARRALKAAELTVALRKAELAVAEFRLGLERCTEAERIERAPRLAELEQHVADAHAALEVEA